jgi:hypothetical protein
MTKRTRNTRESPVPSDGNGHPPGSVCSECGLIGRYIGAQPQGGNLSRVAFLCTCGAIWGFNVLAEEVEKYR